MGPPMGGPPPPLRPPGPPVRNVPMDVNTPFGWKRKQGDSLIITAVLEGKQAEKCGINIGWQIVAVDGVEVSSAAEFDAEIEEAKGKATQSNVSNEVEITFTVVTDETKEGAVKSARRGPPALGGLAEGEEDEEEEKKQDEDGVKKEGEEKKQEGEEKKEEADEKTTTEKKADKGESEVKKEEAEEKKEEEKPAEEAAADASAE